MGLKVYRIFFVAVSYTLLWKLPSINNSILVSILIFCAGLLYDYLSLNLAGKKIKSKYQVRLSNIGIIVALLYLFITFLGFCNVIKIISEGNNIFICNCPDVLFKFKINYIFILLPLGIFPILAGLELCNAHVRQVDITEESQSQSA